MLHQVKEALRVKMSNNEYITLIHEATNEDPWGPTGAQMDSIARVFHNGHAEIMDELSLRLKHRNQSWRSCYKSLLVIDHLARNVHDSMIPVVSALVPTLKQISQNFTCNEKGVDRGLSVRERSRKLVELLTDGQLLRDEREKAEATRRKVAGEPIAMGSTSLDSDSSHSAHARPGSDYSYRDAPAPVSRAERNVALREEQERADMLLALRLQQEEERRAGHPIAYPSQQTQPTVASIPVGRVKTTSTTGAAPSGNQEDRDMQLALEMQRRLDAGEPITPTLFTTGIPSGPAVSKPPAPTTANPPPSATIDSLFDFGSTASPAVATPSSQPAPVASANSFDPFAPQSAAPKPVTAGTDFFDDFLASRGSQNKRVNNAASPEQKKSAHESTSLFSESAPAASNTTSVDSMFEQQMRALSSGTATSSQPHPQALAPKPALGDQAQGYKAPAW